LTRSARETWVFRIEVSAGVGHPGRFMAALLKHLGRRWRVKCVGYEEAAEVRRLQAIVNELAARCAGQAELLSRRAEKGGAR
jgi:hypothetical protein